MSIAAEELKAEGRAEGKAEGKAEGEAEGRRVTLLRQIDRRFGAASAEARSRIESADLPTLDLWLDRILDAKTADDIFAETKLH